MVEGNLAVSDNDWEKVTKAGDGAIQNWIQEQMKGKSCAIVLIGTETAGRKWVTHEIIQAWNAKMGVVGVHIHNLKDKAGLQSVRGTNPFDHVFLGEKRLSTVAKCYDPPYRLSTDVYEHVKANLAVVEEAIKIRNAS